MLPRVLEAEVMDTADEALDYDQMDHSAVNQAFAADFLALWDGNNPILDVGTGTAQIPIEIARQDARTKITGIDLSAEMLKLAEVNIRKAGLAERLNVKLVDAKKLPFGNGSFAAVISNSIIHHIPEPQGTFTEIARVCKPDGRLFVRDLMRPRDHAELRRLVDLYAADANDHQRQLFADSLHAALTLDEVQSLVKSLGFADDSVRASSDRHWTWTAVR
jgi:ubiquinone/menaquinone biosynthesis C-methylase UbiE